MKKRLLSWLLVLTMVISLIPSTLVTALAAELPSVQAVSTVNGKTVNTLTDEWPQTLDGYDITDVRLTTDRQPGGLLTVSKGKTLIIHGTGGIANGQRNATIIEVEDGGHLVLDEVLIHNNKVGEHGAIYVKSGGLLDLGYNDQKDRRAPSITENTYNGAAKNIVIADGARVRLNNAATKKIGISYAGTVAAPVPLLEGGRYALTNADLQYVVADDSKLDTTMELDTILLRYAKPQFLFLDTEAWFDIANGGVPGYALLNDWQKPVFTSADAEVTDHTGSYVKSAYLTDLIVGDIMKYDVIMLCGFYRGSYDTSLTAKHDMTEGEYKLLENFINNGGRVILQCEDASDATPFHSYINPVGSRIAQRLGAGFEITNMPNGHKASIDDTVEMNVKKVPPLTDNVGAWRVGFASPIICKAGTVSRTIFDAKGSNGSYYSFCEDMQAGVRADGTKWGNIMALSDANLWTQSGLNAHYGTSDMVTFAKNILGDSRSNRVYAALGYNPNNLQIEKQATTTTTTTETKEYATPYAALQKAVETNTVTLLTKSNAELTPTRDELLFEQSTLAYEAGSKYDGSTIHADSAGVYLDITKTGEVNLRSGTVTVTPKDATYPLVLNGTMDQDGTAITGGYTITATGAYTLDADDDTTKIKTGNGGGASITIPKAGTSVTVAYTGGTDGKLNGKTITYTATEDNEKFYLGCYTVSYEVEGNVTWTETDLAWDGHDFVTKMTPASGYDAHGEKLAVVDIASAKTYDMENGGTEGTGAETWGIFNSVTKLKDGATPKITVKQQYLHENNVDRNGYATVTVRNVREDITIRTTGNAVESSRPNIYVVGVGVKDGQQTQLWAYTTQRTTDDQVTTKDVEGWPWAKWKVVSAKTAQGTQAAYEGNQITAWTDQTIKNSTTAGGALCPVELTQGDMVVVFEYEWDMVNVKINAKLGDQNDPNAPDFPGYTTQYAEVQRDVESTIYAPNLSGYQSTAASTTITPTAGQDGTYGPYEVTFYYKLAMGQVIYRAVDADGHELATWDGPRVAPGDAVSTDYARAPKLAGYQVKQQNGNATAVNGGTTDKYDGINQITVTWVYEPKTRDVEIRMVEYKASGDHRGAELRTDTTSYARSPVGFTLNLTAPAIPGYTVKEVENDDEISKSKSVFVEDNDSGKLTVYFYYEVNAQDDAKITVQLWDQVNNEEIWSYTVPGQNGEKQLVRVPTVKGYVSDPSNKSVSIAPDDTLNADWGKGTVRFLYSPNTVKVTVKLVDSTKTAGDQGYELNTKVPNYTGSYTVVKGESIDIVAPDVYGYTLADGQDSVHKLKVDKNESNTELTYTIKYIPANDGQVFVHVKGVDKGGNLCYEYTNSVTKGTANVKVTAFAVNGQKLTGATVGADNKFADVSDGELTVDTSTANKGEQIEVVFTYGDNTADVTINAYYKGTTNMVEGFTPFKVKAEIGKPYSYGALALTGYNNDGATPSIAAVKAQGNVLNYYFTKRTGNVIYQLVDANNENHVLATKSESVNKGDAIDATSAKAPEATNWKLKDASNGTVKGATTDGEYDGVHAVTVTYVAVPKTKTVTIYQMDVDTDKEIGTKTVELETGRLHTLQKVDYLPDNGKYTISGLKTVEIYVEDDSQARSVNMYFRSRADQDVTVNLVYTDEQSRKHTIQTYLVQRKPGTTITVKAPDMAYKGYTAKQESVDVQPTQNSVEIEYTVTYYDIEIKLLDENNLNLKTPAGYKTNRKVRKGEGIVLTAPSIADYTLTSALVVSKEADELADAANRTITFKYKNTASANYVTHTIKLMDADKTPATLITQYNSVVTKGNGTTTYLAPLQDGYQVDKKSQEISNAASQDVVFNYTKSAATVTIHFVNDKGQPLMADGQAVADQILTGYEKGQEIMVPAPALTHFALAGEWKDGQLNTMTGVTATLTLNKTAANNEITFAYADRSDVTFVLKDDKGNDIQVINGVADEAYSVAENGKLNLTASGWKFKADHPDNSTEFKKENASVTVSSGTQRQYILHYTRMTRPVTYKYVDVTDGQNKDINFTGTTNNPQTTNVGENLITSAPQIPGYTPNALRNVTFVMTGTDAVTVTFEYIKKATGSITVVHKLSGSDKVITSYTVSGSVGEWFTATKLATNDATGITTDGKYKFTESATNQATQSVQYTADAQTLTFVYEANYVTVNTFTSVDGQKNAYETDIEVVKTSGSQKLYAPSKTGYVLKGIEVTKGSTTDGSPKSFPATGWQDNTLTLTGLTENVEVVYYYEKINDNIKEYQATVKVTDKYESYTLGTWEETVTKDVSSKLTPKAHAGYTLTGYQIGDATEVTVAKDQAANFVLTHKFTADTNVTFFYARTDGSAVVPGKDEKFGNKDDVIIKPNGDKLPTVNADKSVNVPNGAEVVTPNGTVIPPDGSIVKPNGTIVAPDANGKTDPGVIIDPSNPDSSNASYLYVKYLANGGKGEVPTQFFKNGTEITLATNNLTADNKTADGWNTQENGKGTDYANGKELTPTESMTLYAKWSTSAYTHKVTITFNANTGVDSATKTQVIGSYTSTAFGGTLDANTFTLDGWTFRGWNTEKNGSGKAYTNGQEVTFTSASGATLTLYAQWYRFNADGSITIPGKDSTPNTDKDVTIHPNGNENPSVDDKGNVKVPNGAEVTTPNGTIIPPNGSIVKPDGTIVAPDDKGSTEPGIEIDPNKPGDATNKFITVTYKYGRTDKQVADVVQYGKGTVTIMTGNPFTAPTGYQFDGWKIEGSNDKFTGTEVNASTTLVAQWKLAGSVTLAPDKSTDSGNRLETGAKDGELKLVMRGDWAQDKTLTLGALVDGKQSTNEVYWRVDADSYKNEFGFTNSVLTGDQIVSVDANTGKLTVLNSGIVRVWCISKVNPDIKFSVVVVVPGDVNKDGLVDADDIDWTYCAMADPTFIPTQDENDAKTWYIKDLAILHSTAADKEIGADDIDCLYNILFGIYGF